MALQDAAMISLSQQNADISIVSISFKFLRLFENLVI